MWYRTVYAVYCILREEQQEANISKMTLSQITGVGNDRSSYHNVSRQSLHNYLPYVNILTSSHEGENKHLLADIN